VLQNISINMIQQILFRSFNFHLNLQQR